MRLPPVTDVSVAQWLLTNSVRAFDYVVASLLPSHGECVGAAAIPGAIAIRDSKNPTAGHLTVRPGAFATLIHQIKSDRRNLR